MTNWNRRVEEAAEEYLREHMEDGNLLPVIPQYDMDVYIAGANWARELLDDKINGFEKLTELQHENFMRLVIQYDALRQQVTELTAQVEVMEESLLKFGSHNTGCACLNDPDEIYDTPCTCGFGDTLPYNYQKFKEGG